MAGPIEEAYFDWLCAKVLPPNTRIYQDLMRILYTREFEWEILGDRNREEDGLELRQYFVNETDWEKDDDPMWFDEPCSLLEFFIALASRAMFTTDISVRNWFWTFMSNLNLDEYRQVSNADIPVIDDVLCTFVWRRYDGLGRGGIFPLSDSAHDQRKVEYWYQFNEYVIDQALV